MRDYPEVQVAMSIGIFIIALVIILGVTDYIEYDLKSKSFSKAQAAVLQCRLKAAAAADKICGPVPTLQNFK